MNSYTRTYPDFEKLQVGDTVARRQSNGWYGTTYHKHTITKKTATQITLDNGERYNRTLYRYGDSISSKWDYSIKLWGPEIEQEIADIVENTRIANVKSGLDTINWRNVPWDERDKIRDLLQSLNILDSAGRFNHVAYPTSQR